ncbi:nucleotide sugar dehydrogenase [Membranicola marinus]|uniref:Nucleotide sugar dehydrogenase n=1 Tax=Membranihabitans marinus TaxID=1227546 RepID=A0A953HUD1_9BACT|nr:nucleotide sugar dehydrogenase [Membranihabitans marinus]MBY5956626.1 nucleotide sugar dehydrogenase [Membranihabitans marinus]
MKKIGIIGLGYVGLPLAVEFAKKHHVVGFDINEERCQEIQGGHDSTLEVTDELLQSVLAEGPGQSGLWVSSDPEDLSPCDIYIVTVPTPVDDNKQPDLNPIRSATGLVAGQLKKGNIVIYESTVYPGATEEICLPILEQETGLVYNEDFFIGYSPERINPGDKDRTLTKIVKVTSGSTPEVAREIDELYASIITAGTFPATSIRVAEAAKVIENCQRDINIAFVNELAKIFNRMNIDTLDVLEAAGTKWNFLPFRPGLVGGHCIGVDPYYLALKAQQVGYHPEMILAGRRLNDTMGNYVAQEVIKLMVKKDISLCNGRVLILGITFKENCPDIRNTRVIDIYHELEEYDLDIDVYDPWANPDQVRKELGIEILAEEPDTDDYNAILLCVSHEKFKSIVPVRKPDGQVWYDVKGFWDKKDVPARL